MNTAPAFISVDDKGFYHLSFDKVPHDNVMGIIRSEGPIEVPIDIFVFCAQNGINKKVNEILANILNEYNGAIMNEK